MTFDFFFFGAFIDALAHILAFFLSAWGALLVFWGGIKAARRVFWIEAEPWKTAQTPALEDVRHRFGQRIVLGLEFFLAGDILRLLTDPSLPQLIRVALLVLIRVVLSFMVTREMHLRPLVTTTSAKRKTSPPTV